MYGYVGFISYIWAIWCFLQDKTATKEKHMENELEFKVVHGLHYIGTILPP